MKRIFTTVFFSILLLVSVSGHSGRTDSSGGHYNRKTGVYHDHSGSSGVIWILLIGGAIFFFAISRKK